MSKTSEAVKSWRKRTKIRIVESMGGKCYVCGYNKCVGALDLHHIDPSTKLFSLGGLRANPRAWTQIVDELRKCILVCANCHREIETGIIVLKNPKSTFDESFVDYKWKEGSRPGRTNIIKNCEVCGTELRADTKLQKYCSDVCRNLAGKISKDST
jgi:hypothetical protein